ncbi:hypothetical protein [Brucella pseudogrignonensis]|uniref:RNase P/RNase MRP subunit POP5 n=1 Tax=Brucella pseudogrignonensis TaxID=419475 RepID=A0ABU1M6A0_9HYPH|nr:hypothetical protein [Brucella pseudogrignonensis]MDR6431281.1 RNase P/RNase MRP subunit POP5 [Brucella pseudogrignonensis]
MQMPEVNRIAELDRYGMNWHDEMEPNSEGDYVLFSQSEAIIAAERAQTDAYGIALMMIREGCEHPSDIARKALEGFGK